MLTSIDAGDPISGIALSQEHGRSRKWRETFGTDNVNSERSFRRSQSLDDLRRAASEDLASRVSSVALPPTPASLEQAEAGEGGKPLELSDSKKQFVLSELAKYDGALMKRFIAEISKAGIEQEEVEVRFSNLRVEAQVFAGDRGIPTLTNSIRDVFEMITHKLRITKSAKRTLTILQDVSGVLKPGRMTLLLGPPGSGKSSLLKALAGCLDDNVKLSGDITYNGWRPDEFFVERVAAYVSQNDEHIPLLTVRETLQYSCAWQGGKREAGEIKELLRKQQAGELGDADKHDPLVMGVLHELGKDPSAQDFAVEMMIRHFGLDVCADTLVGDAMLRGISGGQKKRVTTSELMVGPKRVLFMDEISTGLDSATTFSIIKALGHFAHILKGTVLVSLLQPAPETFDLFDDIMFLSDGVVAFHGPREGVLDFFAAQGFACPPRKGTADFLQEVTSPRDQAQYWTGAGQHSWVPVQVIADAFAKSPAGVARAEALAAPADREAGQAPLAFEEFALRPHESARINMDREVLLLRRYKFLMFFRGFQVAFMAVVASFLFLRTELDTADVNSAILLFSLQFFALLFLLMNALSEMVLTVSILPVFYKQRDMLFYPGWTFALPGTISRLPFSLLMSGIWSCVVYYLVGYSPNPARFFAYWFLLFLVHCMAVALFRLLGAVGRTQIVAASIGVLVLLALSLSSGFILIYSAIPPWWVWMFWISPLMYAQRAMAVNEFTSSQWQTVYEYGTYPGQTIGQYMLESRDFPTDRYWTWVGFAVLFFYTIVFNCILFLAFSYLSAYKGSAPSVSEDALAALEERRTGKKQAATYRLASSKRQQAGQQGPSPMVVRLGSRWADGGASPVDGLPAGAVDGTLPKDVPMETAVQVAQAAGEGSSAAAAPGTHISALPFEPMGMSFKDIDYFVPKRSDDKSVDGELQLLHGMSGCFRPGRLTALMGASGAGKTTLMDVLAGRKTGGRIEGAVTVGGHPKQQATFSRVAGYVEQFDVHSPLLTVRESLLFSGHLRLPREVDSGTAEQYVDEIMALVEMEPLAGSLVGLPGVDGLSVEQRKRLTIAVELCANPAIVFMDEPTSGLDARAAAIVMRVVRRTVDTQRTVVCTIHQPSLEIFEAFDELLLLKRGGHTIYNSPLGRGSSLLVSYFEGAHPGVARFHEKQNPANWMLDVSSAAEEARLGLDWGETWAASGLNKELAELVDQEMTPPEGSSPLAFDDVYAATYPKQIKMLMWRLNKAYWRMPSYSLLRMVMAAAVATIVGTWFWDKGQTYDSAVLVEDMMGALFLCVILLGTTNANTCMPVISRERDVFYRERAANTYAPIPYAVSIHAIELPYLVVQSVLYSLLTYFLIRFAYDAAKFFWFWWYTFLSLMSFTYFGILQVCLTPSLALASVISTFFYALWNLFAGFLIPRPAMPPWMSWYWYINPVSWTLCGLIESQLGDLNDKFITIPGTVAPISIPAYIRFVFGYQPVYLWLAFVILMAFIGFWFVVSCASLKFLNYQNR